MTLTSPAASPSPWEFGWEALVAIGTLLLAFATAGLALSTRALARKTAEEVKHSGLLVEASQQQVEAALEQARTAQEAVEAAHEQARISQLTLDAQVRPVLIDLPLQEGTPEAIDAGGLRRSGARGMVLVDTRGSEVVISLPFRNAGAGLAMIGSVRLLLGAEVQLEGSASPRNVPPGEDARVAFHALQSDPAFDRLRDAILRAKGFAIEVDYSDLAGQQRTVSRFDVRPADRPDFWDVRVSLR